MRTSSSGIPLRMAFATWLAALSACDGTGGPLLTADGGRDAGPAATADANEDRERPRVVSTDPANGATGVTRAAAITVTFDEPMRPGGSVELEADGSPLALGPATWSAGATTLELHPEAELPSGARIRVTLDETFADTAGNTIGLPFSFAFETADAAGPAVVESTPAPGATGISARLGELRVRFSETMNASAGTFRLEGGGALDEPSWVDGRTVRVPVSGLAYASSYLVVLEGFTDTAGNALDTTSYLVDGAIPFSTGADLDAPRVESSVPAEGQVNVSTRTGSIVVDFDEAMDPSVTSAALTAGATVTTLTGEWSEADTRITFTLAGALGLDVAHALDLSGMRDAAGNALDTMAYLRDGALDFETGADITAPIVLFTDPLEGTTGLTSAEDTILIVFDQAMDTSVASLLVERVDGTEDIVAPGVWNAAGTELRLDVAGQLLTHSSYRVDLSALESARGVAVDPSVYLEDGALDFTTALPTGERCGEELTFSEASGTTAAGGYTWTLAPGSVTIADGSNSCAESGTSGDAVIRFHKSSASGSAGGRYLHIRVDSETIRDITFDVYRDVCSPVDAARDAARLTCPWKNEDWDSYLDVGPGDYYVWVATDGGSRSFEGATVTIEEIDAVPEGESCDAPYTASSSIHSVEADGTHVWAVPSGAVNAADMYVEPGAPGTMSCAPDARHGEDAVIEIVKASDTSVITGVAVPLAGVSSLSAINVQVLDACDPRAATTNELTCMHQRYASTLSNGQRAFDIRGPAGTYYVWLAVTSLENPFLGFTVRARELEPGPGESCETALPMGATGETAITPASTASVSTPSCVAAGAPVTWYRFSATENAALVTAGGAGGVATFEASTTREINCSTDATLSAVPAFVRAGQDVCVAVTSGTSIGALSVEPVAYDGVMGIPTVFAAKAPDDAFGDRIWWTFDQWIAATPSTVYLQTTDDGLIAIPRAGGGMSVLPVTDPAHVGVAAASIGEAVFTINGADDAGTAPRLFRLFSPAGALAPTVWDSGFAYPADGFQSMFYDGADLWIANDVDSFAMETRVPVAFYRVSPSTPAAPALVGDLETLGRTHAIAVDDRWIYTLGVHAATVPGGPTGIQGLHRVRRADLADPSVYAETIAQVGALLASSGSIAIDTVEVGGETLAHNLYFRDNAGSLHVIIDAGSDSPRHLGVLSALGTSGDYRLAYDPSSRSIFMFETETTTHGRIVRLD